MTTTAPALFPVTLSYAPIGPPTTVPVRVTYGHWLPRLFGAGAVTLGLHIVVRHDPADLAKPAPVLLAHELVHVEQYVRLQADHGGFLGALAYYAGAFWQWVIHRAVLDRPREAEAYGRQAAVLAQTDTGITCSWLLTYRKSVGA